MLQARDLRFSHPADPGGRAFDLHVAELDVQAGEVLALCGASGSGKSTLLAILAGLLRPHSGSVQFAAPGGPIDLYGLSRRDWRRSRRHFGFVSQDPRESLNDRRTVVDIVADPLAIHGLGVQTRSAAEGEKGTGSESSRCLSPFSPGAGRAGERPADGAADLSEHAAGKGDRHLEDSEPVPIPSSLPGLMPLLPGASRRRERRDLALAALRRVGLGREQAERSPAKLSGGQRQRVAIARAFVANPSLIFLDEPTSALDVSVQASIVELLRALRRESGATAYVLVTHDLPLARQLADRVAILDRGRIAEQGPVDAVFGAPASPITRSLLGIARADLEAIGV